jgi:hypothetical protein
MDKKGDVMGRGKSKIAKELFKKVCRKCGKKLTIDNYYINREWKSELFRDCWCKTCVNGYVIDRETLITYLEQNKRVYKDKLWEWCTEFVDAFFLENEQYNAVTDEIQKQIFYYTKFFKVYFQQMNRIQYYEFSYSKCDDELTEEAQVSDIDKFSETVNIVIEKEKQYSKLWCGYYTEAELEYLEEHFAGLQRDFKLENASYIDYARKVCKASLAMDMAFSDMCDGKTGAERRFKDFQAIFDQLSQSAKFAEKTRSEHDTVGYGSLGEIVKRIESEGYLQKEITFPKDDIDTVIDEYKWIVSSVGEEF